MNHKLAILYGIIIWAFVLIISLVISPQHSSERPLFESIMPVALVLAVTVASIKYFQNSKKKTLMAGLCLGLIWLGISLGLDLLLFSWGPMRMTVADYLKDIGATYSLIPILTTAFGYLYEQNK
ncbi:MAG: hypothetical protein J5U17_07140 [Candidatus Methanoperedens sp.]|nr:hypothetical protein [Candidatus Methanoperedens sp.]MCE8426777.1 hypothetical protein [Candidatus Methanoperedens sp.]